MKYLFLLGTAFMIFMIMGFSVNLTAVNVSAQNWEYPLIKEYGPMVSLPNAAAQPDKDIKYKVLFTINEEVRGFLNPVNPILAGRIARFINLLSSAGIEKEQFEIAAVISGPATVIVLENKPYKRKSGLWVDNPNLEIISLLKQAGVRFFVCGQSLAEQGYKHEWVNSDITIAVSALTAVTNHLLRGYVLFPE